MSGGLFTNQLLRETGGAISEERVGGLRAAHAEAYAALPRRCGRCRARASCSTRSTEAGIPWAIATSGRMGRPRPNLAAPRGRSGARCRS